jgi:elongation factor 1-alpha
VGWLGNSFGNNLGKVDRKQTIDSPKQVVDSDLGFGVIEITKVYEIKGVGVIPVGRVVEGVAKPGQKAFFKGKLGVIKSIESHHVKLSQATVGQSIGFSLSGVSKSDITIGEKVRFS